VNGESCSHGFGIVAASIDLQKRSSEQEPHFVHGIRARRIPIYDLNRRLNFNRAIRFGQLWIKLTVWLAHGRKHRCISTA